MFSSYEKKPLHDKKVIFIAHVNEISPGTFICYYTGNDNLSLGVFFLINGLIISYYLYVAIGAFSNKDSKQSIKQTSKFNEGINQILNLFFIFYWWIFFTPQVEINSGILVVGQNSFLVVYRETLNYGDKPAWMIAASSIGLVLVNTTNLIIIYCFRDFEFNESILAKRRFHIILIF